MCICDISYTDGLTQYINTATEIYIIKKHH